MRHTRTPPNEDLAVGPAFLYPTPHAIVLNTSNDIDTTLTQFADDEAIVEQGIGNNHFTELEGIVHTSEVARHACRISLLSHLMRVCTFTIQEPYVAGFDLAMRENISRFAIENCRTPSLGKSDDPGQAGR